MPLTAGTTLGPYSVTAKIGEGGMGEVYQARDTKLDRDVALKVLPEAFTSDPDRLARFEREAKVLASLNHPNIGSIYGLEEAEGVKALVLELIEGPTLADRIKQGPIPIDEALPIAKQIAEALEAAHEQGVIHRDLKPANIKVKDDGTVKVLDFGLAKAFAGDASDPDLSQSPTVTAAGTREGVILGTAAYMSPEQARGKPLDKRTDIWSFGCVLFEMVTGDAVFGGQTLSDTIANVLDREPRWETVPTGMPPAVGRVLRRCLARDPRQRTRDIGDARLELQKAASGEDEEGAVGSVGSVVAPRPTGWSRTVLVALVAAAVGGLAAAAFLTIDTPAPSEQVTHVALALSPPGRLDGDDGTPSVTLSPDGSKVVYTAYARGRKRLYVRSLDELASNELLHASISIPRSPFISPDGGSVAYFNNVSTLRRMPIDGGPSTVICLTGFEPGGGSWGPDGSIIFATDDPATGLRLVSASSGEPELLTTPAADEGDHLFPEFLPGGSAVLFTIAGQPIEPYRVCRRAFSLRGWSHVTTESVFPRSTRASGAAGPRARGGAPVRVGRDRVDCGQAGVHSRNAPEVGPAGRGRERAPRWPDDRGTPAREGVGARGARAEAHK